MLVTPLAFLAAVLAVQAVAGNDPYSGGGILEGPQSVTTTAQNSEPAALPPTRPSGGTAAPYACRYTKDPSFEESADDARAAGHDPTSGAWYLWKCSGNADELGMVMIPQVGMEKWLPNDGPSQPLAVAKVAVDKIRFAEPGLRMSPRSDRPQWVNLPTYLWVDRASWHQLSATASVPGLTVSATAAPTKVTWEMGDGTTVICTGPGTPFTATMPAASSSPDCGHVYRRASDSEPGGKYTIRATETWHVTWAGGNQSGTLPDMTTTSSIAVRVAESQALVTSVR